MYLLYSFVLTIGFILLLPRFLFDALRRGKYVAGFKQRLGFLPQFERNSKKTIWLHCVSVGETQAAEPLVNELKKNFPEFNLVVSTTTKTGQEIAAKKFKEAAALVFYFPFDWRFTVRRALRKIRPDVVLIVETEIWFNFLRECRRQNIRIALINGRLSEKSFRRYKLIRGFTERALKDFDLALMSGEADAERLVALGAPQEKVIVTGNIKFDMPDDVHDNELTARFRERFGLDKNQILIIAASTHEPEEKIILAAFEQTLRKIKGKKLRLMLAPRHPERFEKVAELLVQSGVKFSKRSEGANPEDKKSIVILLDSIGELRSVFALGTIVFVGGSLVSRGGHNVLEPIAAKTCVITGFYTFNFASIVNNLKANNALVQLPPLEKDQAAQALAAQFLELLETNGKQDLLIQNGIMVLNQHRGATNLNVNYLKSLLEIKNKIE